MKNIIFIMRSQNSYRLIENFKDKLYNKNDLITQLYTYKDNDYIIHDMDENIYNPKTTKLLAETINVNTLFGMGWNSYFSKFSYKDFIDLGIDNFFISNKEIPYNELLEDALYNNYFFGENTDNEEYTINPMIFYDFLAVQKFPNSKYLKKLNLTDIDTLDTVKYQKFIYALQTYEGFAICSFLDTEDEGLDSINLFTNTNELLIPFNLFKYINKYSKIINLRIHELYITPKINSKLTKDVKPLEKLINIGNKSERSDYLTRIYTRYYFLIFVLKYFADDIYGINLLKKTIYCFIPNLEHKYFSNIMNTKFKI